MTRQITYFIIASIIVIIGARYFGILIDWVVSAHQYVLHALGAIFAGGTIGTLLRKLLALLLIPPIILALPAGGYWAVNRKKMPYTTEALWGVWLVTVTVILMQ